MHVLIVEDDQDLSEMYALALRAAGYRVTVAGNAQDALDVLENKHIGLIVLDILLPRHNGLNVLHELRTYDDWRLLPVIILSSLSAEDIHVTTAHLQQLGVAEYLLKSRTKPQELVSAVARASRHRSAHV